MLGSGCFQRDEEYNLVQAGSIDRTDVDPHDRALFRASFSSCLLQSLFLPQLVLTKKKKKKKKKKDDPFKDPEISGEPRLTLFVGNIDYSVTEEVLMRQFRTFGRIKSLSLILDEGSFSFFFFV